MLNFSVLFWHVLLCHFCYVDIKNYTIGEALGILENGHWHTIGYVTADRQKKDGGRILRIKECKIIPQINKHVQTSEQRSQQAIDTMHALKRTKAQNHYSNATRNVKLRNGMVRKFHIHTLFSLNNKAVI